MANLKRGIAGVLRAVWRVIAWMWRMIALTVAAIARPLLGWLRPPTATMGFLSIPVLGPVSLGWGIVGRVIGWLIEPKHLIVVGAVLGLAFLRSTWKGEERAKCLASNQTEVVEQLKAALADGEATMLELERQGKIDATELKAIRAARARIRKLASDSTDRRVCIDNDDPWLRDKRAKANGVEGSGRDSSRQMPKNSGVSD